MEMYTGVKIVESTKEIVEGLYKDKQVEIWDNRYSFYQNMYVVVKEMGGTQSALTRVEGTKLVLLSDKLSASGIHPKNKEQRMAMDSLLNDKIPVVCLTGRAGTGKTMITLAAALQKVEDKEYDKIIIAKPTSQVGKRDLGILPGDISDKINPYLSNYQCNIEQIIKLSGKKKSIRMSEMGEIFEAYNIEVVPLQLIRGASWVNTFIIIDEMQVCDYHETATIGTRVGEGSKIVILGDLNQRDEKITKEKTGLYKFINDEKAKNSPLVSSIELIKSERGPVSALFADIFEV